MFGYVSVDKSEMLMKDYETYKAVYCSLCKQLGKDYSFLSRFILSYDCTFFALVALSLQDTCNGFTFGRCRFNPLKKCNYLKSDTEALSQASALSVITAYYKLIDNIHDGGFFTKIGCTLIRPFFASWRKKAKKRYPIIDDAVSCMSSKQLEVEKDPSCTIDKAAEPTAVMLSTVMQTLSKDPDSETIYHTFGYFLGKWIYLCDAANDYDSDLLHKSFNPYVIAYGDNKLNSEQINFTLNHCLSQMLLAYDFMDIKRFDSIIENILMLGLPKKQKSILYKETEKK